MLISWLVAKPARRRQQSLPLLVAADGPLKGLSDVAAAAPTAREPVDSLDEVGRQDEVCAHSHAHIIAHGLAAVNVRDPRIRRT